MMHGVVPGRLLAISLLVLAAPAPAHSIDRSASQTPPAPAGSMTDWMRNGYPPVAKTLGLEGTVSFELGITASGSVSGCRVLTSSGHDVLDRQTCALMIQKGQFNPARDRAGVAVASLARSSIRWNLEDAIEYTDEELAVCSEDEWDADPEGCEDAYLHGQFR